MAQSMRLTPNLRQNLFKPKCCFLALCLGLIFQIIRAKYQAYIACPRLV